MREIVGFSHIVIETDNLKSDLNSLIKLGYQVKFYKKKLIVKNEKHKVLYKKPNKVKAIFLESKNSLNIELIEHNIQKKNKFHKVLFGINSKKDIPLPKFYCDDKIFKDNFNIIIKTNNIYETLDFYKNIFNMKNSKISKKKLDYFFKKIKFLSHVESLKLESNLFARNKINFYFLDIKYPNKKYFLNENGISCLSFFDFNKNSERIKNKLYCGPIKLNIKESKINNYYFIKDPDKYYLEILN